MGMLVLIDEDTRVGAWGNDPHRWSSSGCLVRTAAAKGEASRDDAITLSSYSRGHEGSCTRMVVLVAHPHEVCRLGVEASSSIPMG
jgi:hypothetical protein